MPSFDTDPQLSVISLKGKPHEPTPEREEKFPPEDFLTEVLTVPPDKKIKVLIIHTAEVARLGLCELVNRSERLQVCAHTADAPTARELFVRHRPKLAVLGLTLRGGSGIQLIKDFRKLDGAVATLVLSARDDALSIQRALRAGARGYLMMDDAAVEILKTLDEISVGHRYISVNVLPRLIEHFVTGKIDEVTSELNSLSDRELEIFSLMGRGLARMELSMELHTSPKTIETHQARIKDKLALHDIPQLREKAAQWIAQCARDRLQRGSRWATDALQRRK